MLSPSQREEFDRWGLMRLPHAIPPAEAGRITELVWEELSREHGIERDQPDSWTIERPQGFKAISRSESFSRTGVGRRRCRRRSDGSRVAGSRPRTGDPS